MPLSYIARKSQGASWHDVLGLVAEQGSTTSRRIAEKLYPGIMDGGLSGDAEDFRRMRSRHAEASTRLRRLRQWGMLQKNGELFSLSDYGRRILRNPTFRASAPGKGPVSLMRLVRVEDVESVLRRVPKEKLWVEEKHDGWLSSFVRGNLYSRRGHELTGNFPEIVRDLGRLPGDPHLLGELVWVAPDGVQDQPAISSFAEMDPEESVEEQKLHPGRAELILFDLLALKGEDVTSYPLGDRRRLLEKLAKGAGDRIELSDIWNFDRWPEVMESSQSKGGEGVVFKNMDSSYSWAPLGEREPRPMGVWFKMKTGIKARSDDFVVFAVARGEKGKMVASLGQFLGRRLYHVSNMSNLSREAEEEFSRRLRKGLFAVEVGFQDRTRDGRLRFPKFIRFRPDLDPGSVTLPEEYEQYLTPVPLRL